MGDDPTYQSRTDPPENQFGEKLDRFAFRVGEDDPELPAHVIGESVLTCPECENGHVDSWINEGATAHRFKCADCGHVWEADE